MYYKTVILQTVTHMLKVVWFNLAHSCSYPGCGKVLILDGNMKNHRDVCFAKDAGFIKFEGLDGSIKTGCPETPAFKNRYCTDHKPQVCNLDCSEERDESLNIQTGPELRSKAQTLYKDSSKGEPIAEMILGKKTTRKQSYYQVIMHTCTCCFVP